MSSVSRITIGFENHSKMKDVNIDKWVENKTVEKLMIRQDERCLSKIMVMSKQKKPDLSFFLENGYLWKTEEWDRKVLNVMETQYFHIQVIEEFSLSEEDLCRIYLEFIRQAH